MTAAPDGMVDPETVRAFVGMVHAAAARALNGAVDPGMLQLDILHPNGGNMHSTRFPIGAVDAMADSAISAAEGGFNVYVEGRTIDVRASAGRGRANATRGVFAFVDDSDGDKGKAGALPIAPTWSIESSPGNAHNWIVLDRALTADEAEPLGRSLRKLIGSDSATAKLTQPYRVAGTPNYPGPKKAARGRTVCATRVVLTDGPLWSAARLAEVAPPVEEPDAEASASSAGRSGATSTTFDDLIAEGGEDRSGRFFDAVRAAHRAGMLRGDVEDAMRRHPKGCASKYLHPYDRLAEEIARAWAKVEARAEGEAETAASAVDPTYPDRSVPVDDAREALQAAIEAHFAAGQGVRAIQTSTGTGKTRAAARAIAADVRRRRDLLDRSAALYLVNTHRLGEEVAALFRAEGISARVFRGRGAEDPDAEGFRMCLDMEAVELALKLHLTVSKACCRAKDSDTGQIYTCPFYGSCGYQRQIADTPDVWVGAHDLLFSAPGGLGEISTVTVDEAFWQTGLRVATRGITLDDVGAEPGVGRNAFEMMEGGDIAAWRAMLKRALQAQEGLGGLERRHLVEAGLDAALCGKANGAEWRLTERVKFRPGMSQEARRAAARAAEATSKVGRISAVWRAAKDLLQEGEDAVSGRLVLVEKDTEDGFGKTRAVLTHGTRTVLDRWADLPVLILDATLPGVEVLRRFFPGVVVAADIEAAAPHATVRQVVGAPTSSGKLFRSEAGRRREEVRRAILHRFVELGRPSTLVVCQLELEAFLLSTGLPEGIAVGHFNAIAGLDAYKGVGLVIVVGRTMPNVLEVETYAGALSGLEPLRTAEPAKGARFHDRVPLALRMTDGTGWTVEGYRHPDPLAEAARWQICEAGVLQAIGRARAVNRTAADPVQIDVWSDLALPLTVDEAVAWDVVPAGREADMVADGMALESAPDMAACWPMAWETAETARTWRKRSTEGQTPIEIFLYRGLPLCEALTGRPAPFRYQHPGARQKWRLGWYLPDVVADPFAWLEARLGVVLAGFEYLPDVAEGAPETPAAGDAAEPRNDGEPT